MSTPGRIKLAFVEGTYRKRMSLLLSDVQRRSGPRIEFATTGPVHSFRAET